MISLAKRLEELRTAKGLSRVQLSTELGFPKMTVEKFETGRLTPSRQQQGKIAAYFDVPVDYLTGASDDTTTMQSWLNAADNEPEPVPVKKQKTRPVASAQTGDGSSVLTSMLKSDYFKQAVLDVLKTPEGQELIRKALKK